MEIWRLLNKQVYDLEEIPIDGPEYHDARAALSLKKALIASGAMVGSILSGSIPLVALTTFEVGRQVYNVATDIQNSKGKS